MILINGFNKPANLVFLVGTMFLISCGSSGGSPDPGNSSPSNPTARPGPYTLEITYENANNKIACSADILIQGSRVFAGWETNNGFVAPVSDEITLDEGRYSFVLEDTCACTQAICDSTDWNSVFTTLTISATDSRGVSTDRFTYMPYAEMTIGETENVEINGAIEVDQYGDITFDD